MGITSAKIRRMLAKNLPKIGDAYKESIYYSAPVNPTYDPDTGAIAETVTSKGCKATYIDFSFTLTQSGVMEFDGNTVLKIDKKCLLETDQIPGIKVVRGDQIYKIDDGMLYNIIGFNIDPYSALYILHLRPAEVI